MNLTSTEAAAYLDDLAPRVRDLHDRDLFVLLPFPALWVARDRLAATATTWGAQDVHPEDAGAHTGDVSAAMLADLGCSWVEVGHHERRRDHGETDELVAAKAAAVQRWRMTAIVCIGEVGRGSLEDARVALEPQVGALTGLDRDRLVLAYEPAWAIGAGSEPAPEDWVGAAHGAIRELIDAALPAGEPVRIIYGGSVDPESAAAILGRRGVDGLFVGRQALDPAVFAAIAHTGH